MEAATMAVAATTAAGTSEVEATTGDPPTAVGRAKPPAVPEMVGWRHGGPDVWG